jgi:hypothetical protein
MTLDPRIIVSTPLPAARKVWYSPQMKVEGFREMDFALQI